MRITRRQFAQCSAGALIVASCPRWLKNHNAETLYVFGHSRVGGPVIGKQKDVQRFREYLKVVLAHVDRGILAGDSKQEITKLKKLKDFTEYTERGPMSLESSLACAFDERTKSKDPTRKKPNGKK